MTLHPAVNPVTTLSLDQGSRAGSTGAVCCPGPSCPRTSFHLAKVTGSSNTRKRHRTQPPATCAFPQQNNSEINLQGSHPAEQERPGTSPLLPTHPMGTPTAQNCVSKLRGREENKNSSFLEQASTRTAFTTCGHVAPPGAPRSHSRPQGPWRGRQGQGRLPPPSQGPLARALGPTCAYF